MPIVMAAARGIVAHENRAFLSDFGGPFTPTRDWARGVLDRMGFTKRKGTRAAKHRISDLPEIKQTLSVIFWTSSATVKFQQKWL